MEVSPFVVFYFPLFFKHFFFNPQLQIRHLRYAHTDCLTVDSLVAVEMRAWMAKEFQTELSVFDILSSIPLSGLAMKIVQESNLLPDRLKKEVQGIEASAEIK